MGPLEVRLGLPGHRTTVEPAHVAQRSLHRLLAAEEDVLPNAQIRCKGKILVNGLDAGAPRLQGGGEGHRLAVQEDRAAVGLQGSREDVHQGRLAGAVVADQSHHLTLVDVQIHAS